jgi:ATP synthase protein I
MFRVILLQVGATAIAAVAASFFAEARGAISALLGGVVCALPNLLFALRLKAVAKRPGASYPANFLLGELVKMAAIVALLLLVAKGYADLHWPSMLLGLVLATQALFFAFWNNEKN